MKLTIQQYLDLKGAGYTDAEISAYNAGSTPEPTPNMQEPAPAPATETIPDPAPAPAPDPAPTPDPDPAPAPAENETTKLLKQMLGLLQNGNINNREQPTDPTPDPAATMAAVLGPRPVKK